VKKRGGGKKKQTQLTYNIEKTKGQSQKQNGWYKEREESKSERKMVTNYKCDTRFSLHGGNIQKSKTMSLPNFFLC